MRIIKSKTVTDTVARLCIDANCHLCTDVKGLLRQAVHEEKSPVGKEVLENILKNAEIAQTETVAICQDTGMAVFFVEVGQEVFISGDDLTTAINKGVAQGYTEGYLRKSVVRDPLERVNTGDNTPAVIYYDMVAGDNLKLTFAPKGFGSENKSALKMLTPADGMDGVVEFVLDTVKRAGPNPCPPMVVGVGIGGTMDKAAVLSKKALTRPVDSHHPNPVYQELEQTLLKKINRLGIGPQGMGGTTTALAVNIETYPTHIAGLPVAVNISCHVTRHASIVL